MDQFQENQAEYQFQVVPVGALSQERRAAFYRKTYTHVAYAVFLFIAVEALFFQIPAVIEFAFWFIDGWKWLLMLGGFMMATNYAENMALKTTNRNKQYLALGIYVIAEAFIFIPMILLAIGITESSELLSQAAILTLTLFIGLSAVVLLTKKDFSFLKSILTMGFFIALGLIVAGTLFGFDLGLWFSVAMVGLAAGSILYQTSNMVHKYQEEQYVAAALGLFASLMLLFWYILRIFMSRD